MHGKGTNSNATPQPPQTSYDYELHHIITRYRRLTMGANPAKPRLSSAASRRVSDSHMQVCDTTTQLPPSYLRQSVANAELSETTDGQTLNTSQKILHSIDVLRSILEMVNCISASLTLGPKDPL